MEPYYKLIILKKGSHVPPLMYRKDVDKLNDLIRDSYERFPNLPFKERLEEFIRVAQTFGMVNCEYHGLQLIHRRMCVSCYLSNYYLRKGRRYKRKH